MFHISGRLLEYHGILVHNIFSYELVGGLWVKILPCSNSTYYLLR